MNILTLNAAAYIAALLLVLGGAAASDAVALRSAPPPDWRDAPPFVVRPNDSRAAAALPFDDTRATVPVRARVDAEPQAGNMFVARAGDGTTP